MKKGIDNKGFRALPQSVQMNILSNMKYGGRMYNNGGPLLTEFNEGGSHEENPLGGIPQGMGANGQMNVVEEGETKFEDYIFSDQLKLDKEMAEEFDLPKKYVGKTFARISELMNKPNSRREDDSIETADKERNLAKLRDVQEAFKQAEVEAKLAEIDQLDPTAIPNLMQQGAQQQGGPQGLEGEMMQQQLSPEEQQMLEQQAMMEQQQMMAAQQGMGPGMDPSMQGQPMMAYGGPLSQYAFGGPINTRVRKAPGRITPYNMGGDLNTGPCPPGKVLIAGQCINIAQAIGMGTGLAGSAIGGFFSNRAGKNQDKATNTFIQTGQMPSEIGLGQYQPSYPYTGSEGEENLPTQTIPFATGGQMSGGCPPHHHKDNLGICVPNWYVGMLPEFLGMGAAAIGGGMYGAKTAKAKREKDAAVKKWNETGIDPTISVDPTIVIDRFQSENMDNNYAMGGNLFPIQSYRAGGNCYGCGGKMYGYGGNMYTTGGQLMAGIAGGAAGLAESLLPGQLGSMASGGIETLYNKFDKKGPSEVREQQEDDIFKNAKNVTSIIGDVGESIFNPASIPGNIASIANNTAELIGDNANLNKDQQMLLNATQQGFNVGSSLLGKYASGLFKDTPINVAEGEYDISGMLPTNFKYGGKLNSFANGGSLDDEGNRYLVSSEPNINANGIVLGYTDTYKVGGTTYRTQRRNTESIMSEKELINYLKNEGIISKNADIAELEKKSDAQRKRIEEEKILDERRRQSGLEAEKEAEARRIKQQQELAANTLDLTPMLEGTPMDDNYVPPVPPVANISSGMGPSPEAPVGGILNLGEAQIYNPDLEAWDPSTVDEDNLTPEMRDMIIKQSPLSAIAGFAPMAYNLYQGLSPVDKVYTPEDFYTPAEAELVDYTESKRAAREQAAGLMKSVRNLRPSDQTKLQSAYQSGIRMSRKVNEAEADANAKIENANEQFNKKLLAMATKQAEELNIKSKTAKQEHIKETMKGFADYYKMLESNKMAAQYSNMMNPYINFSYEPFNPFKGLLSKKGKI